jgi:5-methylcytosine-specific restriction endonuclease McrA
MPTSTCQTCNTKFKHPHSSAGLFCNRECYYKGRKALNFQKLIKGEYSCSSRGEIRKVMIENFGHKCAMCNNSKWLDSTIPLELDHIDGDAGNNKLNNLRLLCPNCHATTPTHKAKNKGFGRAARGLPTY